MRKQRPILFSGSMVRAILDGHKTQTRRVVNLKIGGGKLNAKAIGFTQSDQAPLCWYVHIAGGGPTDGFIDEFLCPFGQPGDRLWVRETWAQPFAESPTSNGVIYRADGSDYLGPAERKHGWGAAESESWKPSIHMPRKYCRLLLDVRAARVERLNDITEEDAIAEGCSGFDEDGIKFGPQTGFRALWNTINDKRGFRWETNPWVWVIDFEVDNA